jgi:hypothetical protein
MRKHRAAWLFGLASIAIVTSARTAHALGPIDIEVGAKAGVGTEYSGGLNPFGFGVGGRAGVVLPSSRFSTLDHLYFGASLMYYFGTSETVQGPISPGNQSLTPSVSESVHTLMYGGEFGLGFKPLDSVTIRPQVGVGSVSYGYTVSSGTIEESGNPVYVEPGVTVLVALGTLFVGADVNALVFPGRVWDGAGSGFFITVHGQVGVKF